MGMLGEVPLHGVVVRPGRTALAAVAGGRYGAPCCPYSALVMFRAVAGSTCSASAPCARRRSAACRRLLEIWAVREARPIVEAGVAGCACIHLPEVSPFRARRSEPTAGFYAKKILCFMEKRDAVAMKCKAYLARHLVAIGVAIPPPRLLTYIYLKYTEAVPHAEKEKVYLWRLYGIVT
jgi:hypothetical protein